MNKTKKITTLKRDTIAMMVPSGARIMLHEGTEVTMTQALGNAFTVNVFGNLARIDSKDADALGCELEDPLSDLPEDATTEERVMTMLKMVYDPEIPVNIVDLGLIYTCSVKPNSVQSSDNEAEAEGEAGKYDVRINMTLTAPGCGMGPVIVADVKDKVEALPEINQVAVEMIFDPPWDRSMMSELAKLELGMM